MALESNERERDHNCMKRVLYCVLESQKTYALSVGNQFTE